MAFSHKRVNKFAKPYSYILLAATFFPAEGLAATEFSEVSLMAGLRQDSLDWNINGAGNPVGASPNILSELTWRDLEIFQLKAEISASNISGIYFRGSASYGWVLDGENQDSDYAGDNRTLEFSRSINGVDGSRVMDFKGGLGVEFPFGTQKEHRFVPLLGYSYHSQQLRMTDGNQVVSNSAYFDLVDPDPLKDVWPIGSIPGLNSSYNAVWSGVWVGADFLLDFKDKGSAYVHLERHWPNYLAKANWNLRDNFAHPVSFEHEANGRGWVLELGWHNRPSQFNWEWGVSLSLQQWNTEAGIDRTYVTYYRDTMGNLVTCTPVCIGEQQLNEVNWFSSNINITLSRAIRL